MVEGRIGGRIYEGGNVSARERKYAWKNIWRTFFFFYFCFFRVDLDEGKGLRSFVKDIRVFRYNLKDIKDILV